MGRRSRFVVALVGPLAALAAISPVVAQPIAPADPVAGWTTDVVRLEPVEGAGVAISRIGEFRGAIEVRNGPAGLSVVNEVGLEDYLLGISEVPVGWPAEAQKAQAIAARTYALHEAGRAVSAPYRSAGADICATQACQVYVGMEKERRPGSGAWAAAVRATAGEVVLYKGRPILAKYSSSNGGRSVAGGQPYLRAVDDPDDRHSPLHSWRSSFSLAEVARALGLAVEPVNVHRAGDSVIVQSIGVDGVPTEQRVSAADFRSRLNAALAAPPGVPLAVTSNRFTVSTADGIVVVAGGGWGHGIGLSQYGALGKALRGMRAPDILASYYGGLRPSAVPPEQLPSTLKVAVALDQATVAVEPGSPRFRVVDGSGSVLAHGATGAWTIMRGPRGTLRVVPAGEDGAPPTASVVATDPETPAPGAPLTLRLQLDGPAAVTRLQLTPPGGTPVEVGAATLRPPGRLTVHVARPAAAPGRYRLDVERDAGGGRTATSTLEVDVTEAEPVAAPAPHATARDRSRPEPGGRSPAPPLAAVAAAILLSAVALATVRVGRTPARPLH